ncbi:MAG TPA: LuxR C-terminal-related transcriptional regulator [Chloroflexota bacterium]
MWQASAYLWPTRPGGAPHAWVEGAARGARSTSGSARLRTLWRGVAQVEQFGRAADRLANTMRQINRLDKAALYEGRAEQARQRVALVTSFLTTIELSHAAIESYWAQLALHSDPDSLTPERTDVRGDAAVRDKSVVALTPREQEVAALIARGFTNRQVAEELVIGRGTAANHVAHILAKLGCRSRTELVISVLTPRRL